MASRFFEIKFEKSGRAGKIQRMKLQAVINRDEILEILASDHVIKNQFPDRELKARRDRDAAGEEVVIVYPVD